MPGEFREIHFRQNRGFEKKGDVSKIIMKAWGEAGNLLSPFFYNLHWLLRNVRVCMSLPGTRI